MLSSVTPGRDAFAAFNGQQRKHQTQFAGQVVSLIDTSTRQVRTFDLRGGAGQQGKQTQV